MAPTFLVPGKGFTRNLFIMVKINHDLMTSIFSQYITLNTYCDFFEVKFGANYITHKITLSDICKQRGLMYYYFPFVWDTLKSFGKDNIFYFLFFSFSLFIYILNITCLDLIGLCPPSSKTVEFNWLYISGSISMISFNK